MANAKQNLQASLLASALASVLATHKGVTESVQAAIADSITDSKLRVVEGEARTSAWSSWINAGKAIHTAFSADGMPVDEIAVLAGQIILSQIPKDASEKAVATIATYTSRVSSMVPIFALSEDAFATLYAKAFPNAKPEAVNRLYKQTEAVALIRASKGSEATPQSVLNASIKTIVEYIRELAKVGKMEGSSKEEKDAAKLDAIALAQSACDEIAGLYEIKLPELKAQSGETMPEVVPDEVQLMQAQG